MAAGEALGVTGLKETLVDLLIIQARPARENPGAIDLSCLGKVAGEVVVPGLKETLIDLLMILKVKLGGFLHRRLSRVGMAAGEALGLTVLEGVLVALDLIVLKVKMERLSCLGEVSG